MDHIQMSNACQILPILDPIAASFKGILLDAYGVFWGGNDVGLLPGSRDGMERLVLSGKVVGILSNTTQLADQEKKKFRLHGLFEEKHYHFVITSGEIGRSIFLNQKLPFKTPRNTFWTLGGMHLRHSSHEAIFQGTLYKETPHIKEADFAYISIPQIDGKDQVDPELFRKEVEEVKRRNLPMVCPNPDRFAHEGKPPRAVVRQGSIAKMYEEMKGEVFYIGKPYQEAYAMAMEHFIKQKISRAEEILMVGDTPETDIRGARNFGIRSALLTETGITADRIAAHGLQKVVDALPLLDHPDFFIGRLAHGI